MIHSVMTHRIVRAFLVAGGCFALLECIIRIFLFYSLPEPQWYGETHPNYWQYNTPLTFAFLSMPSAVWMLYYGTRRMISRKTALVSIGLFGFALGLELVFTYLLNVTAAEWTWEKNINSRLAHIIFMAELRGVVMGTLYFLALSAAEYDFKFGRTSIRTLIDEMETKPGENHDSD